MVAGAWESAEGNIPASLGGVGRRSSVGYGAVAPCFMRSQVSHRMGDGREMVSRPTSPYIAPQTIAAY